MQLFSNNLGENNNRSHICACTFLTNVLHIKETINLKSKSYYEYLLVPS